MGLWAGTYPARGADYPRPGHHLLGDTMSTTRSDPQAQAPPTLGTILCDANAHACATDCADHRATDLCASGQVLCHGQVQ